ncbi:MAG: quinolinate synthase NadA [Hydrogenibacillus sp.]|nr:quinolinate synthase NadA [Hydrogenibacillus sp.]
MAIEATSERDMYEKMKTLLAEIVPDAELRIKAEIAYEINRLKTEKNALILGHNYMEPALYHTVPDIVGDSLELSRRAAETDKPLIVFLGVHFMAETAKILNPEKTVLIPSPKAGCSLAESITAEDVRHLRAAFPGAPVVAYVNTSADVKAESDICCTSSNAAKVVAGLDAETVIFIPDAYLARNVAKETGKRVIAPIRPDDNESNGARTTRAQAVNPQKGAAIVAWHGRCEVHERFTVQDIERIRAQFPDVVILAHPECRPDVVAAADFSGSTSAMIRYVKETEAPRYLLLTECSMGDNIAAENPHKTMLRLCSVRCPHMNQITLENTLDALRHHRYEVDVPEPMRARAVRALERMLAVGCQR